MDFGCGGGSFEHHVVEASSETKSVGKSSFPKASGLNPLCGCVKDSNFDDDDTLLDEGVEPDLSMVVGGSDVEEDHLIETMNGIAAISTCDEAPVKKALDTIQQTLDETIVSEKLVHNLSLGITTPARVSTKPDAPSTETPTSHARQPSLCTTSPSPSLLNPLSTNWKEPQHLVISTLSSTVNNPTKSLLCPTLDTSTTMSLANLLQRMEEGFRVRLTGGPISCLADEDEVLLYLHPDHSRLCVESVSSKEIGGEDEKKQQETVDFWIELPINDILRLESTKSPKSFSIVVEKEVDCLVYYDFETSSAVVREVLVSTIMIVLDQTHHSQRNAGWTEGGTLDQPIPCSPSLEQLPIPYSPSLEHPAALSPGAHQQLSPSKRTQIYNSADRETETSLVIHLEDLASADQSDYWGHPRLLMSSNRDLPTSYLQQKSSFTCSDIIVMDDIEEARLDFKPSASSTHLTTVASSSQLATAAWCGGNDICTLALRDIAETCTGIFAIKQAAGEKTPLHNVGSDQLVVIEEFIAAALGAPATFYTCFAEGDIWSIETSASKQQHNMTTEASKAHRDSSNAFVSNRASLLNAQAARLRNLRNEMTFAAALKQSKERMQFVQTVRSFDDAYYARKGKGQKLRVATEAADRFHTSPLLKSVVESMTIHDTYANTQEVPTEDVAYYDSDPEDIRPRTTHNKAPRRVVADRVADVCEEDVKSSWRQHALSGTAFEDIGTTKKLSRKLDEDAIVEMVHVS
jgi:hypothetical protein